MKSMSDLFVMVYKLSNQMGYGRMKYTLILYFPHHNTTKCKSLSLKATQEILFLVEC